MGGVCAANESAGSACESGANPPGRRAAAHRRFLRRAPLGLTAAHSRSCSSAGDRAESAECQEYPRPCRMRMSPSRRGCARTGTPAPRGCALRDLARHDMPQRGFQRGSAALPVIPSARAVGRTQPLCPEFLQRAENCVCDVHRRQDAVMQIRAFYGHDDALRMP